ncbi:acyltransferase [Clostridium senegalense]|uniref:N-acetyltransferase n=1 Tax=Clostridium senegalense TaxID=1465809 RepID=A0A6M0H770_9CLOT|nr:acyltransferase [Clostridium senegalense]NEU05853.1 N-acetyltransferase [Clostridium senegalense]
MSYFKHSSAEVSENANIKDGTKIWNNSQVRENCFIGENCIIGTNVYIDFDAIIGNNVKIQNGVNVYHGVVIEDDVFVGPSVTFTNDMYPRAFNNDWEVVGTLIKKGAAIGANSTVICGITIGEYAMVGSGSVVTDDINPYELVAGNPAKKIGYVCKCGNRLDENHHCDKCNLTYKEDNGILSI